MRERGVDGGERRAERREVSYAVHHLGRDPGRGGNELFKGEVAKLARQDSSNTSCICKRDRKK